jgi:O-acetyl-ADP-ribose deacetylase (regulator of RNase III)
MTTIRTVRGDITRLEVDAIVNAANSRLAGGGGVDGAIHRAGGPVIAEQCQAWISTNGRLATGEAMATEGGELPARIVIHTVGPIWGEHDPDQSRALLASCYTASLDLALAQRCSTVAFPNISTGVYRFPRREAAEVAIAAVRGWIEINQGIEEIDFVCFDSENYAIYSELLGS